MKMKKDKIYSRKKVQYSDFNFGKKTAAVFDDMLDRSVPFYREIQRMIGEIANEFARNNTNVYDLGCSTGTTMLTLARGVKKNIRLVGVDYSEAMLDKCRDNFKKFKIKKKYTLECRDLNNNYAIKNASVVVLNLTLQFIRPVQRDILIQHIYQGMVKNGCLIIVEKVLGNDSIFNRVFIKFYYEMKKRNGYTQLEIAQKREELENVLIPYRMTENEHLLQRNGFRYMDIFYKWYNFYGMVAIK